MKFIDYGGETIALILAPPNRATTPKLSVELPTEILKAISDKSQRRNFARTMRYSYEYAPSFPTAGFSTEFRLGLNRLKDETVAVPMWEDGVKLSASVTAGATTLLKTALMPVRSGAEWIILSPMPAEWDGWIYEIVTVSAITSSTVTTSAATLNWPAGTMMFPLLFGLFAERPRMSAITPSQMEGTLKFIENSPFDRHLTVTAGSIPVVGANVSAFSTLPLWTLEPNFVNPIDTTSANILRALLGPGPRQESSYVVPGQANARGLEMQFTCNGRDAIAFVERMFTDRRATTKLFMVPTFRNDLKITQDLPLPHPSENIITIQPSEYSDAERPAHPGDPFLALIGQVDPLTGLTPVDPARIIIVAGGTLTTELFVSIPHPAAKTRLSHLLLVRFAEAKLTLEYITPSLAVATVKFLEEPGEYASLQADLAEPLFLYRFTEKTPTPRAFTFTNYENSRIIGDQVFAPGPFDHGAITISLAPGETKTELMSWGGNFTGNPLAKFLPNDLEGNLEIEIFEADAATDAPLITLFKGDVMNITKKGPDWKSDCVWLGKTFRRKIPHFLVQKPDNNILFSRPMGLAAGPFNYVGVIDSMDAAGVTLVCHTGRSSVGNVEDQEENFFAGGYITIGNDDTFRSRAVIHSAIVDGFAITIDRPLPADYVGVPFNLFPGYDGSIAQLIARFDPTGTIHGGHPFVTDTGPQIKAVEAKQSGGGKKG